MALDTSSLTRLSVNLYDACYDADAWPLAAQALRDCLDSMAATLVVRQGADFETVHSDCDADFSQRYWRDFSTLDPMLAGPAPAHRIYCDQTVMDRARFQRSALFNDWLRPQDRHSVLLIKIPDAQGEVAAIFSLNRGGSQPCYSEDDLAVCRQLAPLLTHAVRLQDRIARLRALAETSRHPAHESSRLGLDTDRRKRPLDQAADMLLDLPPDIRPHLQSLFDLSPKEADLAYALMRGLSLREAAQERHVGLPTVRSQLASLLRKTGTARQGQLIALLARAATT